MNMKWNACIKRVSSFVKKKITKKLFNFYLQNERREKLPIVDQNHWSEEIEWNEWIENGSNKCLLPKICYTHHRLVFPFEAESDMN